MVAGAAAAVAAAGDGPHDLLPVDTELRWGDELLPRNGCQVEEEPLRRLPTVTAKFLWWLYVWDRETNMSDNH